MGGSLAGLELFDSLSGVPTPGPIGDLTAVIAANASGRASFQVDRVTVGTEWARPCGNGKKSSVAQEHSVRWGGLEACGCREPGHLTRPILVYEASESISSERPGSGTGAWGSGTRGRPLMQRPVRTMSVVMLGELLQHLREVAGCGCRELGHVMRPARTRERGRRVDPVAVVESRYRRVGECGGRAAADAGIGAGGEG